MCKMTRLPDRFRCGQERPVWVTWSTGHDRPGRKHGRCPSWRELLLGFCKGRKWISAIMSRLRGRSLWSWWRRRSGSCASATGAGGSGTGRGGFGACQRPWTRAKRTMNHRPGNCHAGKICEAVARSETEITTSIRRNINTQAVSTSRRWSGPWMPPWKHQRHAG